MPLGRDEPAPQEKEVGQHLAAFEKQGYTAESSAPGTARSRRPRRLRLTLLSLGPLIVIAAALFFYLSGGRYAVTENAYVKADKVMISAEVPGPIVEVAVRENQRLAKGDVLFVIDGRPYRIALAAAEARLANAKAELLGMKAVYKQRENELALARTKLEFASRELDRQTKLVATNAVSQSKFDATNRDYDLARQEIAVIKQELAQIRAELGGDENIRIEAHPRYLEAKAAKDRAALDLEHTVVRAPLAGIAGAVPNPGQQVTGNTAFGNPVMNIVADTEIWIEANYKETELTYLEPGQQVSVEVDAYPDARWRGRVESISQATGAEFSVIPPQNATGNWVKIVQRIPVRIAVEGDSDAPALRSGMSTTVRVDTGHRRSFGSLLQAAHRFFGMEEDAERRPGSQ